MSCLRLIVSDTANNNNSNNQDGIYSAVIMTQNHCESLPTSSGECRLRRQVAGNT